MSANWLAPRHLDQGPLQPGYTNPYGYGVQRTAGQLAPQPVSRAGMLNSSLGARLPSGSASGWSPAPQATPQYAPGQAQWGVGSANVGAPLPALGQQTPQQAGYTPLIYGGGGDQDTFIGQQHAAYQQWLATPAGQQWAAAQSPGEQWFGQPVNGNRQPAQQIAGYIPGVGWGMHADPRSQPGWGGPRTGGPPRDITGY